MLRLFRKRLQMNNYNRVLYYKGAVDCAHKLHKEQGFAGFYRGLPVAAMSYALSIAIYQSILLQMKGLQ